MPLLIFLLPLLLLLLRFLPLIASTANFSSEPLPLLVDCQVVQGIRKLMSHQGQCIRAGHTSTRPVRLFCLLHLVFCLYFTTFCITTNLHHVVPLLIPWCLCLIVMNGHLCLQKYLCKLKPKAFPKTTTQLLFVRSLKSNLYIKTFLLRCTALSQTSTTFFFTFLCSLVFCLHKSIPRISSGQLFFFSSYRFLSFPFIYFSFLPLSLLLFLCCLGQRADIK